MTRVSHRCDGTAALLWGQACPSWDPSCSTWESPSRVLPGCCTGFGSVGGDFLQQRPTAVDLRSEPMPSPLSPESSRRPPPVPKGPRKVASVTVMRPSRIGKPASSEPDPALDEEELEAIVAALRPAAERRGLARTLAVAQILVARLYSGAPDAFRSRGGKPASLRKLVKHGAPLSSTALYRALSVHEIWVRVRGHRWPQLGAAHYRAVEALDPGDQEGWLEEAAAKQWSAARLRQTIVTAGAIGTARGGRLPSHPLIRLAVRVERELARVEGIAREINVPSYDRKRMGELAERLDVVGARCREYADRLRRAVARASGSHDPID